MKNESQAGYYLRTLRYWIDQLRWFIQARASTAPLSELDERECEAFPYEWDNVVGRVGKLAKLAEAEELDLAALAELRGIAEELTALEPTMQRLRLRVPALDALARAAGQPATAPPT